VDAKTKKKMKLLHFSPYKLPKRVRGGEGLKYRQGGTLLGFSYYALLLRQLSPPTAAVGRRQGMNEEDLGVVPVL
jgi:hypothetical protein